MDSLEKIIEIISENLSMKKENVLPESGLFDDLGCDELDIIEISMAIEEEFNCEISDDAMDKFNTVKDIAEYVDGKR